jgi:hypothetical protein
MKKLFILLFGLMILSCNPKVIDNIDKGDRMLNTMNGKYSIAQFDSMCVADTLPRSLSEWKRLGVKDYESHQRTYLYLYMKINGRNESVYKVEDTSDDSVKIIKRITTD